MTCPCPLCAATGRRVLGRLDPQLALAEMGLPLRLAEVSEGNAESVELIECSSCGLHYFTPSVVGSAHLYERLSEGVYYQPLRWDQEVVLQQIQPGDRIVDLGCGSGSFVEAAALRGAVAVGVDFSASAGPGGARRGEYLRERADLGDDAAQSILRSVGEADRVTAFQLVEHLSAPVEFMRAASTLLAEAGRLTISVPNRNRFEIDPVQALDCPPHHQTRWAPNQIVLLGRRAGLSVESVVIERTLNPLRVASRLSRRLTARPPSGWTLPPAAGPWPPWRVTNGMSIVATYTRLVTGK